jgi:hypothetical protein
MLCGCVRAIYAGYCWLLYATFGVACVAGPQLLVANFLECRCGVPTASVSVRQCDNTDLDASYPIYELPTCNVTVTPGLFPVY